ncbi:hypothetical protein LXL04_015916 [Taraxacum kok-saghyz]
MESGNSGSLQSSSGAEAECDSRAAVHDSGFITNQHHQLHPPPPPPFNHHLFDQNQFNSPLLFTLSPQHQLNLDSKTLPSFSDHHLFPSSSHSAAHTVPFSPVTTSSTEPITTTNPPLAARNPKKRSRASRRAPTTVLTTDTSNFRAMVQEFTGIPAPPFTSSSPAFPRLTSNFDLFGRPSAMMRSNTNNLHNLTQLTSCLLPPFPQKLQSSTSSSSSISSLLDSTNLLSSMQNTISFPSNSLRQLSYLNQNTAQIDASSNGFCVIGQTQIHGLDSTLPDHVSTTGTAARNRDQMASGNWNGGVKYSNEKAANDHGAVMKGDQECIEPWGCSSD